MKKRIFVAVLVCIFVIGLAACGGKEIIKQNDGIEKQPDIKVQEEQKSHLDEQQEQEAQDSEAGTMTDEELEENLAAYREARENAEPISLGNGVTMGGSVNPEEYGISFDASPIKNFDTREIMDAIDTANSYVENTLGISIETKHATEMCVDPRIWAIYEAEDKGVANGYESEDIYLREYCDNGAWQYLILVRKGKGSPWEVIHYGNSYME